MTSDPVRLLEAHDLSAEERELLEAGRTGPTVDYDAVAGGARFRASLVLLGAAGAASTATSGARAASSALAKIATKAILAVTLPALAVGAGVGAYRAFRPHSTEIAQSRSANPGDKASADRGSSPGAGAAASPSSQASMPSMPLMPSEPPPAVDEARPPSDRSPTERGTSLVGAAARSGAVLRVPAAGGSVEPPITRVILEESEEPGAAPSSGSHSFARPRPDPSPAAAAAAPGSVVASSSKAVAGTGASTKPTTAPPIVPNKARPPSAASTAPTAAARAAPAEPSSDAIDEMRAIAHARNLIAQDPAAALRALDEIRREHPSGYFGEERRALTIFALARSGNQTLALERAKSFVRSYPNGPFTDKVRSTAGLPTP